MTIKIINTKEFINNNNDRYSVYADEVAGTKIIFLKQFNGADKLMYKIVLREDIALFVADAIKDALKDGE